MFTYNKEQLAPLKAVELKKILGGFCLSKSGTKTQMVDRIIKYQEDEKQKKEALAIKQHEHELMLAEGAKTGSQEYEAIMGAFDSWCTQERFEVNKYGDRPCTFELVPINEIRYTLRHIATLEQFYDEFFNVYLDTHWYLFPKDAHDGREFDCDSPCNDTWLMQGMNEILMKQG